MPYENTVIKGGEGEHFEETEGRKPRKEKGRYLEKENADGKRERRTHGCRMNNEEEIQGPSKEAENMKS
jgi:hypothetical protein